MFYAYDTNGNNLGGADNKDTLIQIMADNGLEYDAITDTAPAIPEPTLDELKAQKLAELKQARDSEEVSPLNNFDVDEKSLSRIDIASKILATGTIDKLEWTMADNTVQAITSTDFTALYVALATRSNELHEKYRALKEAVNNATDAVGVEKIKW